MLKRVLVESGETGEDEQGSHHSESVTECHGTPRQHAGAHNRTVVAQHNPFQIKHQPMNCHVGLRHLTMIKLERFLDADTGDAESNRRTDSSSPCSSRGPPSPQEGGNASTLEDVRQTILTASQRSRRDQQQRWSQRKHKVIYFPARSLKVLFPLAIQQFENISTLFQHQQNRSYAESQRCQDEDQAGVDEARLKAQEAVSRLPICYRSRHV